MHDAEAFDSTLPVDRYFARGQRDTRNRDELAALRRDELKRRVLEHQVANTFDPALLPS